MLDGYVLERVLGEGGMGVVFAARHVDTEMRVAIKTLLSPPSSSAEERRERFFREARLAAKIRNDHVVRVLDVTRGDALDPDGRGSPPYIVMEYLDGFDLDDLLRARGPLRSTEAVDYVLQACEGVAAAHALGVVHRDLKPSNLHLTRRIDGTPLLKVLDFGISKTGDDIAIEGSKLTTTTAVFGSPAYMSPEQIRSSKHVDERTDVWSLAVVLFELITGRLPFAGDSAAAVLAAIAADPPLSLSDHAKYPVPSGLEKAIERGLVKDRSLRVASVVELAASLAPFASEAGRASFDRVLVPRRRRGRFPLLLTACALVTGFVVVGAAMLAMRSADARLANAARAESHVTSPSSSDSAVSTHKADADATPSRPSRPARPATR